MRLNFNVLISDSDRRPRYVDQTVNSLRQLSEPVTILVDGPSDAHLADLLGGGVTARLPDSDFLAAQANRISRKRAAYNYHRLLTFDTSRDLLALENDAVLCDDFAARLTAALAAVPDESFILAVFHEWAWCHRPTGAPVLRFVPPSAGRFVPGEGVVFFPLTWANTACVYWPSSVLRSDLTDRMMELVEMTAPGNDTMYDQWVGFLACQRELPIYLMTPPGARHIGLVSSVKHEEAPCG